MAPGNLELARGAVGSLKALFDLFADDIVWDSRFDRSLDTGIHSGKPAVIALIRSYVGTWADFRFEADELVDAGDSVVLMVTEQGRGKGSSVPVEQRYCLVWTFRDQRIVRATSYESKAQALEALGLTSG